jgi:hypothetical protein
MKSSESIIVAFSGRLGFLYNYLEGTAHGPSKTNDFAFGTPIALFCGNDSYNIVNQHESIGVAHVNTQTTSVTLLGIYQRHFNHFYKY